jgi:hypothetical protein
VYPYPDGVRERLAAALFGAWTRLDDDGFLTVKAVVARPAPQTDRDRLHA